MGALHLYNFRAWYSGVPYGLVIKDCRSRDLDITGSNHGLLHQRNSQAVADGLLYQRPYLILIWCSVGSIKQVEAGEK